MKTTLPRPGVLGLIGNTPLIRLGFASEETGCEILAKAEFMNPGGSIKDRTAAFLLNDAIARGHVARGGRVVEGTGGNTGIGLAMVGAALGVATTIFMAETQTPEKQRSLRMLGVDLRLTPAVPFANPLNYVRQAEAFAASEKAAGRDVHYLNQWDNPANHEGHRDTTAPELWAQVDGRLDGFVMAVGTGGTLAGFSEFLKAQAPQCVIAAADPPGASVYHWVNDGCLQASEGSSIAEGIGQGRLTGNLAAAQIDTAFRIEDHESLSLVWRLLAEEGLAIGHSSAVNVAGAIQLAKRLGPGHRIATILCDGLGRYESKLGDVARLQSLGLPPPPWLLEGAPA